jgi:hypothetical protein
MNNRFPNAVVQGAPRHIIPERNYLTAERLREEIRRLEDSLTVGNYYELIDTITKKKAQLEYMEHCGTSSITTLRNVVCRKEGTL